MTHEEIEFNTRTFFYEPLSKNITILMQSSNGPCMLIAIFNCLVLRNQLEIQPGKYSTSVIISYIYSICPTIENLNLDMLVSGYNINPIFSACTDFKDYPRFLEYLKIPMYHGMLPDPTTAVFPLVSELDYESFSIQALESFSSSSFNLLEKESLLAFFDVIQRQVTQFGLDVVETAMKNNDVAIFFRSNHFSVLIKHMNRVFSLITDESYLSSNCIWETLPSEKGESKYFDQDFILASLNNEIPKKTQPAQQKQTPNYGNTTMNNYPANNTQNIHHQNNHHQTNHRQNLLINQQQNPKTVHKPAVISTTNSKPPKNIRKKKKHHKNDDFCVIA
ncbi:hypothetical protein TRFO_32605 [Tritrichomonas foetus]|uniref:MINDY deubiquitinase domain-containing protein n=1 Tax=Tritrichomonas foetus TaxID=1144522 RepID=A0A1J4JSZ3_9EUKA|nr:hypothetical protein TRFO_32605 [Tritrichomonas foetus]|eukprot:OHT00646.1 hypothetical protein TRFO_32605 [Tritrichomonas foetus]